MSITPQQILALDGPARRRAARTQQQDRSEQQVQRAHQW